MTAMKGISLNTVLLELHLSAMRAGPMVLFGALLCGVAFVASVWVLPGFRGQNETLQAELNQLQQAILKASGPTMAEPPNMNESRVAAFYGALGDARYVEQQVKTLFAVAAHTGLHLEQAQYKSGLDVASQAHTYQITLPVSGSYAAVRAFCTEVLIDIPFASLDEMDFKRESVSANLVEATLRFTLYLNAPKGQMTQPGRSAH